MRPFGLERAPDAAGAGRLAAVTSGRYLAGGTVLLDLMKLDVIDAGTLVDINDLAETHGAIGIDGDGLTLGALVRMAEAEAHPAVRRYYPVIRDALAQAASPQLRNMASLGGNVLQKTRCSYYRDPSWAACNKRTPGSGCAAMEGVNRRLAVLGTSEHCIAHYPGDFAVALVALGADVMLRGTEGTERRIAFEDLHRLPGDTPHIETNLQPGELITGFHVPAGRWTRRSLYRKVRDRASYDFALASAAVALDLEDGVVVTARIGLGGVATKPWRAHEAEAVLAGRRLDEHLATSAAEAAFAGAMTLGDNGFKPELGRRTLVRALLEAAEMDL
ncbi:FAD binding domain-containing protein [Acidisoma sp.]|uniref:FAD binding domain-containing protein n=1 Tax=Acidisoma sp. TaxID=1872115 RepID=UPI003B006989